MEPKEKRFFPLNCFFCDFLFLELKDMRRMRWNEKNRMSSIITSGLSRSLAQISQKL